MHSDEALPGHLTSASSVHAGSLAVPRLRSTPQHVVHTLETPAGSGLPPPAAGTGACSPQGGSGGLLAAGQGLMVRVGGVLGVCVCAVSLHGRGVTGRAPRPVARLWVAARYSLQAPAGPCRAWPETVLARFKTPSFAGRRAVAPAISESGAHPATLLSFFCPPRLFSPLTRHMQVRQPGGPLCRPLCALSRRRPQRLWRAGVGRLRPHQRRRHRAVAQGTSDVLWRRQP